jgi:ABC-type sulfate/molybdate transport systems ATPase subunit
VPADLLIDARLTAGDFRLDVTIEVARGPLVLVGPNGAGKTTLLRALAGGPIAVDGRIVVGGQEWTDLPPEARQVGYLPQGSALFPHLSALDNVAFGAPGRRRADRRAAAQAMLDDLGAGHLARRRPLRLSGGEQQRIALARALARRPALLLLDEPTAALDVTARREIRDLLAVRLREAPCCGVVVSHDLRDLLAWSPTVALLDGGRVQDIGTIEALSARSEHPFLQELLAPLQRGT